MRNVANLLNRGFYYFGSSSSNSPQFDDFFEMFKKSFTRELKKIHATNIQFSKGHFFLSGFFTVQEQIIYFSISDVRGYIQNDWRGLPQLLIRTAKSYTDYTGGANNFISIEPNIGKQILKTFRLDETQFVVPEKKEFNLKSVAQKTLAVLQERGVAKTSMPSVRKANLLMWEIGRLLNLPNFSITITKYGRTYDSSEVYVGEYLMRYDVSSKTLKVEHYV